MLIVYAQEEIPKHITKSIFLAGPTVRKEHEKEVESWRRKALQILSMMEFDGVVFVPEPREGTWGDELTYSTQIEWEEKCLNIADNILFWIPRDMKTLPGLTTNVEWGMWADSGKVILGYPKDAQKVRYLEYYAKKYNAPVFTNLYLALSECIKKLGAGSIREGGEVCIPLELWENTAFKQWYNQIKLCGNRLDDAKVLWTYRLKNGNIFCFSIWAKIWIQSEQRYKENEFVLTRPDISTCVLYYRAPGANIEDTEILMVKEFRVPVSNSESMVCEVPGGSSFKPGLDNITIMLDEVREETGMEFTEDRVRLIGNKQLYATMLSHKAHVYAIEMNQFEVAMMKSRNGQTNGNIEDTEITYPQMMKMGDALRGDNVDWSNIGMLLLAVLTK